MANEVTYARPLAEAVEELDVLDAPGKAIGKRVRGAVPAGPVKDALSGTWLGHALHPLLTDLVIGTWTSGLLLDLAGGRDSRKGADLLVGAGIASYFPTALTGVTDWADSEPASGGVRRVGLVHAAGNAVALGCQVASLAALRRGDRKRGVALSLAANAMLGFTGFLGSHMSYVQGVGVDQTVFDPGAEEWTPALPAGELGDEPASALAGETPVLLVRHQGRVLALHDRCSHRGCALSKGTVDGGVVECACHGSRFSLEDGGVLRGPATAPQPAFEARERDGQIEVRLHRGKPTAASA